MGISFNYKAQKASGKRANASLTELVHGNSVKSSATPIKCSFCTTTNYLGAINLDICQLD